MIGNCKGVLGGRSDFSAQDTVRDLYLHIQRQERHTGFRQKKLVPRGSRNLHPDK
jgi:hypothetical protein